MGTRPHRYTVMMKVRWGLQPGQAYLQCDDGAYTPLVKPITKHGNSAGVILEQTVLKMVRWGWALKSRVAYPAIHLCSRVTSGRPTIVAQPTTLQSNSNPTCRIAVG